MQWENRLRQTEEATKWWWVFLATGILWLIVSLIVFRFDIESVEAVGILIAAVVIVTGVNEFMAMGVTEGGWKWVHAILGGIFVVVGVLALFNPWDTFVALAAMLGWVLLFLGIYQIIVAFITKQQNELWWLQLIVGGAAILLAFWAAGWFGRKVILLIAFTGAWALMEGISQIILAFQLRSIHKHPDRLAQAAEAEGAASRPAETGPSSAPA
ncbi:MAG: HdeD family acid-resistance protein [Dehalococcoidia bacterium]